MSNPVIHFEVLGKDGKKLQEFFAKLFDWKIDANNPMNYGMVEAGEGGIGGGIATGQDGQSHVTFYVGVDDVQKYLDKAESLGGKTVQPPTPLPDGPTIGLFTDPEGHLIGLVTGM